MAKSVCRLYFEEDSVRKVTIAKVSIGDDKPTILAIVGLGLAREDPQFMEDITKALTDAVCRMVGRCGAKVDNVKVVQK
mgnify:CR=1 FL=1